MTDTPTSGRLVPIEWLQGAFAMRAAAYANMFDVLRDAFGTDRAVELVSEATRRMGVTMGAKFADLGPANLIALKERFIGGIPAVKSELAKYCSEGSGVSVPASWWVSTLCRYTAVGRPVARLRTTIGSRLVPVCTTMALACQRAATVAPT